MTPLGLAHIMGTDDHYGPAPWINNLSTANWNPFYYHKADATGIGFDRTSAGSNAVSQYAASVRDKFASRTTVGDDLLLFFHRVRWDDTLTFMALSVALAARNCARQSTTEPLPFGIHAAVAEPGHVRVGDPVLPL